MRIRQDDLPSLIDLWRYCAAVRLISIELFGKDPTFVDVFTRLTPAAFQRFYMHEDPVYVAGRLFAGVSSEKIDNDQALSSKYRCLKESSAWIVIAESNAENLESRFMTGEFA